MLDATVPFQYLATIRAYVQIKKCVGKADAQKTHDSADATQLFAQEKKPANLDFPYKSRKTDHAFFTKQKMRFYLCVHKIIKLSRNAIISYIFWCINI